MSRINRTRKQIRRDVLYEPEKHMGNYTIIKGSSWVELKSNDFKSNVDFGKWMYKPKDKDDYDRCVMLSHVAIDCGVCSYIKYQKVYKDNDIYPFSFFCHYDDWRSHRQIIMYFKINNLFERDQNGRLKNCTFKLAKETKNKDIDFSIHLSDYMDLDLETFI